MPLLWYSRHPHLQFLFVHSSLPVRLLVSIFPLPSFITKQIKKNTAPHELKPSDILIDRFTAWKQIVKMLIGEYQPFGLSSCSSFSAASDGSAVAILGGASDSAQRRLLYTTEIIHSAQKAPQELCDGSHCVVGSQNVHLSARLLFGIRRVGRLRYPFLRMGCLWSRPTPRSIGGIEEPKLVRHDRCWFGI